MGSHRPRTIRVPSSGGGLADHGGSTCARRTIGMSQHGQAGTPTGPSTGTSGTPPTTSGAPEWKATRWRLAFAAGWQNP